MCVIAIKFAGTQIEKKTVEDMWAGNPDGGGLAIVQKDHTAILKGYETPDEIWLDIKEMQDQYLVIHFRIKTHGAINPEMTHPFVVTPDLNDATPLNDIVDKDVLFHNGILSHFGTKEISDTADFVTGCLAYMPTFEQRCRLLSEVGSKFVLVHEGESYMFGHFEKHKGLMCSNTLFSRNYSTNYPTTRRHGKWNYDKQKFEYDEDVAAEKAEEKARELASSLIVSTEIDEERFANRDVPESDPYFDNDFGEMGGCWQRPSTVGVEASRPRLCGNIGKETTPLSLVSKKLPAAE